MSARGVRTRAALLDAARSSFAGRGPGAVSIRDLAAEAGCTHPLVGRYFGGKGGLEQAVGVDLGHRLDAVSVPSDAAPDDIRSVQSSPCVRLALSFIATHGALASPTGYHVPPFWLV